MREVDLRIIIILIPIVLVLGLKTDTYPTRKVVPRMTVTSCGYCFVETGAISTLHTLYDNSSVV